MKKSKDTFELIHSLSKSEKRYIKLSISVHKGEQDHIKLFDVLEALKEYDESKIRELLKGEKLLGRLHVVKNYLYHQILKSLRSYHNSISVQIEVNSLIHSIYILYKKGLPDHAQKMIEKARKICEQHELFSHMLELDGWEIRLLSFNKERFAKADVSKILKNNESSLNDFIELGKNWLLLHHIHTISHKMERGNFVRNKKTLDSLPNIKYLLNNNEPRSFRAKTSYYQSKVQYCGMIGDLQGQYKFSQKLVTLFIDDPDKIYVSMEIYISGLQNYFTISMILKKYDDAFFAVKKLKEIKIENSSQQNYLYIITLISELSLYHALGNAKEGIAVFQKETKAIEFAFVQEAKYISYLYGNVSYLYFMDQKYKEALKWANKSMKGADIKQDVNVWLTTKIIYLMIHFELGNFDLLTSLLRSEKMHIKKNTVSHVEFYSLVLNFFTRLLSITNTHKGKKIYEEFDEAIHKAIAANPIIEKSAELGEYFLFWIKSKKEGIPYLKYIQLNSNNR